ncbi:hypothetical protein [Paenibacillus pinihumi]|uniref:hypothetical protein n=1 Tax=Paenibacillus pinihumi TaxID=669462 RepID=UPI0004230C5A|nr:hypothetical protein [Paenibacillus pinihumi]
MAAVGLEQAGEIILSSHESQHWARRRAELTEWISRKKETRQPKGTKLLAGVPVDVELHSALKLINEAGAATEFSCAGVSMLDEPLDHSLYAYVTLTATERSEAFVRQAMNRMRHRLLVAYEPERRRYDLSSFLIGHNRSFCLLIEQAAREFSGNR